MSKPCRRISSFFVSMMIATCIIQGGEVPACFAKAVADYLVFDHISSPVCLEGIPDYGTRMCLQKGMRENKCGNSTEVLKLCS